MNRLRDIDGWGIVELLNTSGAIHECYTRGVSIAGHIGGLVSVTRHAFNTQYYVHNNHRGDVIHVRSGTSTTTTYRYSAFGQLVETSGPNYSRFKFSSKEFAASCGLYYCGYRFYAPQWQRWISRDPSEESGGMNLFLYIENCPVADLDPSGLSPYMGMDTSYMESLGHCFSIARNRTKEYHREWSRHRGADLWYHCVVSCELTRACGESEAWLFGYLREMGGPSGSDRSNDEEANKVGRECGCNDKRGCEACCEAHGFSR